MSPSEVLRSALRSGGQALGTVGASLVAEPLAGLGGLYELARTRDSAKAAEAVRQMREGIVKQIGPEVDESGQRVLENIAAPFEWLDERVIQPVSDAAYEVGGPVAGTAVNAVLNMADPVSGRGGRAASRGSRVSEALRLNAKADEALHAAGRANMAGKPQNVLDDVFERADALATQVDDVLESLTSAELDAFYRKREHPNAVLERMHNPNAAPSGVSYEEGLAQLKNELAQEQARGLVVSEATPREFQQAAGRPINPADEGSWSPRITTYGDEAHRAKVEAFLAGLRGNERAFVNPLAPNPSLKTMEEIAAHYSRPGREVQVDTRLRNANSEPRYIIKKKENPDDPDVFEEVEIENPDWYQIEELQLTGPKGGRMYFNPDQLELDAIDARGVMPDDQMSGVNMAIGNRPISEGDAGLLYQVMNSYALANDMELPSGGLTRDNRYRLIGNQLASYARHGNQPRRMGQAENLENLPIAKSTRLGGYDLMALEDAATRRRLGMDFPVEFTGEGFRMFDGDPMFTTEGLKQNIKALSPDLHATLVGPKSLARSAVYEFLGRPEVEIGDAAKLGKNWDFGPLMPFKGTSTNPADILKRKLRETAFNALTQQGESDGSR